MGLTAYNAIPRRFEDKRHELVDRGLEAAGFDLVDKLPADVSATWNLHSGVARQAKEQSKDVFVFEEAYTRGLSPVKAFACGLNGHNGSGRLRVRYDDRLGDVFGLKAPAVTKPKGENILICLSRGMGVPGMAEPDWWADKITQQLHDKPTILRPHPRDRRRIPRETTLAEDMEQSCALVTWGSQAATAAALAGLPAYYCAPSFAAFGAVLSWKGELLDPEEWLRNPDVVSMGLREMAYQQFTESEIEDGACFRWLLKGEAL